MGVSYPKGFCQETEQAALLGSASQEPMVTGWKDCALTLRLKSLTHSTPRKEEKRVK